MLPTRPPSHTSTLALAIYDHCAIGRSIVGRRKSRGNRESSTRHLPIVICGGGDFQFRQAMAARRLPRRILGGTGLEISVLGFGASPLGSVFQV